MEPITMIGTFAAVCIAFLNVRIEHRLTKLETKVDVLMTRSCKIEDKPND